MNFWFRIGTNKPHFRELRIELVEMRLWNSSYPSGLSRFSCLGSTSDLFQAFISFTLGTFLSPKTMITEAYQQIFVQVWCRVRRRQRRANVETWPHSQCDVIIFNSVGLLVSVRCNGQDTPRTKTNKSKRWRRRSGFRRMLYI